MSSIYSLCRLLLVPLSPWIERICDRHALPGNSRHVTHNACGSTHIWLRKQLPLKYVWVLFSVGLYCLGLENNCK